MNNFKEINPKELGENPFNLIGSDWALVTCGTKEKYNTMTISWGGVGIMWGKPVAFTFIRPQRYTFDFMENEEYYTMSFMGDNYRDTLNFCGTKSGRDFDKVKECGITPIFEEAPYFEEAKVVFVCKKMYGQFLNEDSVCDKDSVSKWYKDDYHKMYVSEIVKCYVKE